MRTTRIDELEMQIYAVECTSVEVQKCPSVYDDVDFVTMYDELKYEIERLVCF